MPWVESHTVLIRHRKVFLLAQRLKLKPVLVIGHMHLLWHAVMEQKEDGDLAEWPDEMIAQLACYEGNPQEFVAALIEVGWLDADRKVHDWWTYAGRYLRRKYATANPEKYAELEAKWPPKPKRRRARRLKDERALPLPPDPEPVTDGAEFTLEQYADTAYLPFPHLVKPARISFLLEQQLTKLKANPAVPYKLFREAALWFRYHPTYGPNSPTSFTDPEKIEQWLTMMHKAKAAAATKGAAANGAPSTKNDTAGEHPDDLERRRKKADKLYNA